MTTTSRSRMLVRTALGVTLGAVMFAGTANAQKQGGSITVGLETDIPGFDPLKVGVFDTAAETAAAAMFDTLTTLDAEGAVQLKLAFSWESAPALKTWTFKLRTDQQSQACSPYT